MNKDSIAPDYRRFDGGLYKKLMYKPFMYGVIFDVGCTFGFTLQRKKN